MDVLRDVGGMFNSLYTFGLVAVTFFSKSLLNAAILKNLYHVKADSEERQGDTAVPCKTSDSKRSRLLRRILAWCRTKNKNKGNWPTNQIQRRKGTESQGGEGKSRSHLDSTVREENNNSEGTENFPSQSMNQIKFN